ncbi:DNA repair protein RecO [Kordiimonas marina]|uniref:DNA repair protein RecO n=1 Tax=Kordiimonas marina TaxID=2872312 RepID=UPI001FF3B50A|nr:DNA repair protein RecO [Kordiimonas marina]MCJ9429178.1 DNA repair protein RecO [Kordiimonas marina]
MEWQDDGIVLSAARYGESDALLEVMTASHGRVRGFVKGGSGRRQRANLQVGNRLRLNWYSRIEANLGRFSAELVYSPLGLMMGEGARLSALSAVASVIASTLPEREDHAEIYERLLAVLDLLEEEEGTSVLWAGALARLELAILSALGYGLDLTSCAATGTTENLAYVSPKSARAVSREAAGPYKERLLPLPGFLLEAPLAGVTPDDVLGGLRLTGFFLDRQVWVVHGKGQPPARDRFIASLMRATQ